MPGIAGCTFNLEGIPKAGTVFATYGNKLETGLDFRYQDRAFSVTSVWLCSDKSCQIWWHSTQKSQQWGKEQNRRWLRCLLYWHPWQISRFLKYNCLDLPIITKYEYSGIYSNPLWAYHHALHSNICIRKQYLVIFQNKPHICWRALSLSGQYLVFIKEWTALILRWSFKR